MSSYVQLDDNIFYGIHPMIVDPVQSFDNYIILTTEDEVPEIMDAIYYPIADRRAPTYQRLISMVDEIDLLDGNVYIACRGGHGRSGLIAGALYAKRHGTSFQETINHLQTCWSSQRDMQKIRPHIRRLGSPQSKKQKDMLEKYIRDNN